MVTRQSPINCGALFLTRVARGLNGNTRAIYYRRARRRNYRYSIRFQALVDRLQATEKSKADVENYKVLKNSMEMLELHEKPEEWAYISSEAGMVLYADCCEVIKEMQVVLLLTEFGDMGQYNMDVSLFLLNCDYRGYSGGSRFSCRRAALWVRAA